MEKFFDKAAEDIRKYGKDLGNDELLTLYSLFKQAKVGDCNKEPPSMLDLKEKAKYDAWMNLKGKPQNDAKKEYVEFVLKYLPDDVKNTYK
jgi:diazepam-binding inhibitor (GABA receptor modulating acyl-CoA-binding protein)